MKKSRVGVTSYVKVCVLSELEADFDNRLSMPHGNKSAVYSDILVTLSLK